MAKNSISNLPGFRDLTPDLCLFRNYLFETWRRVANRYGFVEYEAPALEPTELYLKKSGGELSSQLFSFEDQGGRQVTLRPELTASLARMAATYQREYPKPLKWFEIGECYRYESPQKGRLRSFYQFNADILGEAGTGADAELISVAIDTMRELGFCEQDFVVRLSDRNAWVDFAEANQIAPEQLADFLSVVDKLERDSAEETDKKLVPWSLTRTDLEKFINDPGNASEAYQEISANLQARGLADFIELDLSIVRGLAYYTGTVFEIFDTKKTLRAVAGGGRYDTLIDSLSDGSVDLPATGFAMGDVVIGHLIEQSTEPTLRFESWKRENRPVEIYVVIADEANRPQALKVVQDLRDHGIRVDYPLMPAKFNKQFKAAEACRARFALIIGSEFPELSLKILAFRQEESYHATEELPAQLKKRLSEPDGPLLA